MVSESLALSCLLLECRLSSSSPSFFKCKGGARDFYLHFYSSFLYIPCVLNPEFGILQIYPRDFKELGLGEGVAAHGRGVELGDL